MSAGGPRAVRSAWGYRAVGGWEAIGRLLVLCGLLLVLLGGGLLLLGRMPFLGRLPGDIVIERARFRFYFPLATCLLLSAVLSLVFWLLGRR